VTNGYTEHDLERYSAERFGIRGPHVGYADFADDRERVLRSQSFRSLAGKTQAMCGMEGKVPRTRLTHSLEVASVARFVGGWLGCDVDLLDTAGLAHDIGHPPFGHNGERALREAASAIGGFEANAQNVRVLTRLEPGMDGVGQERGGLNLTRASLDAICKYPWPADRSPDKRKFGFYPDDITVFEWFREGNNGHRRCVEAQVMDFADDVAGAVHDLEDGVRSGFIDVRAVADRADRAALSGLAVEHFAASSISSAEAGAIQLLRQPAFGDLVRAGYDGAPCAESLLKQVARELVLAFTAAAVLATRSAYAGPCTRYAASLIVPDLVIGQIAVVKSLVLRDVLRQPKRRAEWARQRALVAELVALMERGAPQTLDPVLTPMWIRTENDAERFRIVVDQVASLTENEAVLRHHAMSR
jgi:dGTPase